MRISIESLNSRILYTCEYIQLFDLSAYHLLVPIFMPTGRVVAAYLIAKEHCVSRGAAGGQ